MSSFITDWSAAHPSTRMTPEELQRWASQDIVAWCTLYANICPNCGLDFDEVHPLTNLVPHWLGECKLARAAPRTEDK